MAGDLFSDWTVQILQPLLKRQADMRAQIEKTRFLWEMVNTYPVDRSKMSLRMDGSTIWLELTKEGRIVDTMDFLELFEDNPAFRLVSMKDDTSFGSRDIQYHHIPTGAYFTIYIAMRESRHCVLVDDGPPVEQIIKHQPKKLVCN